MKKLERDLETVSKALAEVNQNAKIFQNAIMIQETEFRASQQLEKVNAENKKLEGELQTSKDTISRLEARVAVLEGKETECVQND